MLGSFAVQVFEILVEALPLSACAVRLLIRFIGLIDQAEVVCSLETVRSKIRCNPKASYVVKSAGNGRVKILQEVTTDIGVIDVLSTLVNSRQRSSRRSG